MMEEVDEPWKGVVDGEGEVVEVRRHGGGRKRKVLYVWALCQHRKAFGSSSPVATWNWKGKEENDGQGQGWFWPNRDRDREC